MSINLISRIFADYHKGKDSNSGRKYRYTIEYNPLSAMPIWVIRQPLTGGNWDFVQPFPSNLQITPLYSARLGRMVY